MKQFWKENLPYIVIPFGVVLLLALAAYLYFEVFQDDGASPFVYTFGSLIS